MTINELRERLAMLTREADRLESLGVTEVREVELMDACAERCPSIKIDGQQASLVGVRRVKKEISGGSAFFTSTEGDVRYWWTERLAKPATVEVIDMVPA